MLYDSRLLALKLAKAHGPCALQIKKTELMKEVGDAHGLRSRRTEDIADWLRVLYRLEYCEHPLLIMSYCGAVVSVALLEKHEQCRPDTGILFFSPRIILV